MSYLVANGNAMNLRRPIRYTLSERDIDFKILSRLNLQKDDWNKAKPNEALLMIHNTNAAEKIYITVIHGKYT